MAVYTGRRTRRQIIDQALKRAGTPKITAEARVKLARALEDLYVQHEWPFLYTTATLTLAQSVALPAAFLKVESPDTGLRGTSIDGSVDDWPIFIKTPTEWRRMAIPRAETAERPDIAMVDYSGSFLYPWPIPSSSCTALLVYKFLPSEVDPADAATFDADVPLFPYHGYLEDLIEEWALSYDHSPRASTKRVENADLLQRILGTATPKDSNQASSIELDPAIFREPRNYHSE